MSAAPHRQWVGSKGSCPSLTPYSSSNPQSQDNNNDNNNSWEGWCNPLIKSHHEHAHHNKAFIVCHCSPLSQLIPASKFLSSRYEKSVLPNEHCEIFYHIQITPIVFKFGCIWLWTYWIGIILFIILPMSWPIACEDGSSCHRKPQTFGFHLWWLVNSETGQKKNPNSDIAMLCSGPLTSPVSVDSWCLITPVSLCESYQSRTFEGL